MHNRTVEMINNQIARELRNLNSIFTDEADKPAIIQRIAELKAMIDDPSGKVEHQPATAKELVAEIIAAFRRR